MGQVPASGSWAATSRPPAVSAVIRASNPGSAVIASARPRPASWLTVKTNSPSGPDATPMAEMPGTRPRLRLKVAMLATLTRPRTTTRVVDWAAVRDGLAGRSPRRRSGWRRRRRRPASSSSRSPVKAAASASAAAKSGRRPARRQRVATGGGRRDGGIATAVGFGGVRRRRSAPGARGRSGSDRTARPPARRSRRRRRRGRADRAWSRPSSRCGSGPPRPAGARRRPSSGLRIRRRSR